MSNAAEISKAFECVCVCRQGVTSVGSMIIKDNED